MNDPRILFALAVLILYLMFTTTTVICENTLTIKNWAKCIGLSLLAATGAVVITISNGWTPV